ANGFKWWKTTRTMLAPFDRIFVHTSASRFHGVWLDETREEAEATAQIAAQAAGDAGGFEPRAPATKKPTPDPCKPGSKAQLGVLLLRSKKYALGGSRKSVTGGDSISRHAVARLTGDVVNISGAEYDETDEGWWLRAIDAVKTNPGPP